jgi:drug/metabolite transporter (DMT)-like permease
METQTTNTENNNKRVFFINSTDTNLSASVGSQINSINLNDTQETTETTSSKSITKRMYDLFKEYYGLILAIVSTICITCSIFLIKISIVLNAADMAVVAFVVQIVLCIPFGYFFKQNLVGPKDVRCLLITRALAGSISAIACYFSVKLINFSDAISIKSIGFILTAIMAHFFLKEKFTFIHFISIFLSSIGILCIIRPTILFKYFGKTFEFEQSAIIGYSLALFGTFALSNTFIFVKKLTNKNIHFSIIVFYFCLVGLILSLVISSCLILSGFTHETWELGKQFLLRDISLGIVSGLCQIFGHICFTLAIKSENANKIALFRTLDILIAYLIEYFILKIIPNLLSMIGSSLILIGVSLIFIYKITVLKNLQRQNNAENFVFRI